MSTIDLSISALFAQAFGYKSSAFDPKFAQLAQSKLYGKRGSDFQGFDSRGVEYYLPVQLNYYNGSERVNVELPHPVVGMSQGKNIVKTPLTEVAGTVKEMVSLKDVEITIRGLLISKDNDVPEDEMYLLQQIFASKQSITMRSVLSDVLLEQFNYGVVIEDIMFPEVKGVRNVKGYELKITSDSIFNLIEV
jgi:hypothetical protein